MNLTYSQIWNLVHDTVRDASSFRPGDLDLVDTIVDKNPGLMVVSRDPEKFADNVLTLVGKYRKPE